MNYQITEDALTDSIFNNTLLDAMGSGTKADARLQARAMLAGPALMDALRALLAVVNVRIDDPRIVQFDRARAAIAKAEGGAA